MNNNAPIGIFDSGLGGLTILKKIQKILPNENYIYFGDTAHLPYGTKSKTCIIEYSKKIANFLIEKNVKAIVIACNSASSVATQIIKESSDVPIFEVIQPVITESIQHTKTKNICIIGTEATINSKIYSTSIYKINSTINTIEIACPLFVPIIEEGLQNTEIALSIAKLYLNQIIYENIDTLILGCTHYTIILDTLKKIIASNIHCISSGKPVGECLKKYLNDNQLSNSQHSSTKIEFYVSDDTKKFQKLGSDFLNHSIDDVSLIEL